MPINSKYLFVASMDVDPDKEALFNEVYDTEHVPNLLKVPGVHAVTRTKGEPFAVSIGGEEKQAAHEGPRYSALYEIDGPHVLVSAAWAQQSNAKPATATPPPPTISTVLNNGYGFLDGTSRSYPSKIIWQSGIGRWFGWQCR